MVTVLVAYALLTIVGASSVLWQPRGTLGMTTDYGAVVRSVDAGGPAALAGIAAGDRIDLSSVALEHRRDVVGVGGPPPIGDVVAFRVSHLGVARDVRLTAVPAPPSEGDRSTILLQCAASLIFIVVGATLIMMRPSAATWGFGLYCLLDLPTASIPFRFASSPATFAAIAVYDIVQNAGVVGLLVFALEFPARLDTTWRRRLRASLGAVFVALCALTLFPDVATLIFGTGAALENHLLQIVFGVVFVTAIALLNDTYVRIAADGRERMRWVLLGFIFGLATNYIGNTIIFSSLIALSPPGWVLNVLVSLNVLLPLTVAHAVIRHRVLDITFVISRALIYAAFTTILAALFGLLDWFFGIVLDDFRLSRVLEAAISIAIAFAFNRLHKSIEDFIEAIFFRQRRAAEARLARLSLELPHARTQQVIETVLIDEATDALGLTSAAVFLRDEAGAFARVAARAWPDATCLTLDDTDVLVLTLRTRPAALKLTEISRTPGRLPAGAAAPLLALPMIARTDLVGIVLYGGHASGGDIDAEEAAWLERLVLSARVALDAIDADRLRDEHARQQVEVATLRARVDELRHLAQPQVSSVPDGA